jgi:hypothetical protein
MKPQRSGSTSDNKEQAVSDQEREYKIGKLASDADEEPDVELHKKDHRHASDADEEPEVELHKKDHRHANEDDSADTDGDDFELHKKHHD